MSKTRIFLPLLVLLGVMIFLFIKTQSPDLRKHEAVIRQFRLIDNADQSISRLLLEAQASLIKSYEPLNRSVAAIRQALKALRLSKIAIYGKGHSGVDAAFKAYLADFQQRIKELERCKSQLSIYKNANYYFPIYSRKFSRKLRSNPGLQRHLEALTLGILTGAMHPKIGARYKPQEAYKALRKARIPRSFRKAEREEWDIFLNNAKNIMAIQKPLKQTLRSLLHKPHQARLTALLDQYIATYNKAAYAVAIYRIFLYILAISLLLYLTLTVLKLGFASQTIAHHNKQLQLINVALDRFVPHEFLQLLSRQSIKEVQLGDSIEREMTVFFSDIRSFTSISETMTPEENFRFINSYLSEMGPIVKENQGFIDKYIGDAIMALFDGEVEHAIHASNQMLSRLKDYNYTVLETKKRPPIRIGIGLHVGTVMLGTVGEENRMDSTVISDAVNLASRIEGLTKSYGVNLLISHAIYERIKDPSAFHLRKIDQVTVKGKSQPIVIYEVFDEDTPKLREAKKEHQRLFEKAVGLWLDQQREAALNLFRVYLEKVPHDTVAEYHIERMLHFGFETMEFGS